MDIHFKNSMPNSFTEKGIMASQLQSVKSEQDFGSHTYIEW